MQCVINYYGRTTIAIVLLCSPVLRAREKRLLNPAEYAILAISLNGDSTRSRSFTSLHLVQWMSRSSGSRHKNHYQAVAQASVQRRASILSEGTQFVLRQAPEDGGTPGPAGGVRVPGKLELVRPSLGSPAGKITCPDLGYLGPAIIKVRKLSGELQGERHRRRQETFVFSGQGRAGRGLNY